MIRAIAENSDKSPNEFIYNFNTVNIVIHVLNVVNDNAVWSKPVYVFRIHENLQIEYTIGHVLAFGQDVTYNVPEIKDNNGKGNILNTIFV